MSNTKVFHMAWSTKESSQPVATTSPFYKQWRAWHKVTCPNHGLVCHVYKGIYFSNEAPSKLFTDFECLGCGEHYREGA